MTSYKLLIKLSIIIVTLKCIGFKQRDKSIHKHSHMSFGYVTAFPFVSQIPSHSLFDLNSDVISSILLITCLYFLRSKIARLPISTDGHLGIGIR